MAEGDLRARCPWCGTDPLYVDYHDREWGTPLHNDRAFFELLILEGAQAGLSWYTILKRREGYRAAYDGFDPEKVAAYGPPKLAELAVDARIIRNRAKIAASVANARAFLAVREAFGSFDAYFWRFVDGKPVVGNVRDMRQVPATTPLAETVSRDLKARGFGFVGPTIVYAFMQSAGLVNDHLTGCFRFRELAGAS
ncbi:DNA-3-methyladenine glycosylase I [Solidesulfovibrio sp.]|uniref:DNA-3-methyladenine glycosylase I n=1 Tax=Solidesulfovibrio sp. TaxID=2910990 RepID=UPI002B217CDE|nr:DNA-3-methyladenine glycosylase I [Solidesulfovibrio sp.]MEA4857328.1 DNA-3-methyladenine glycosylase I [Solidesulfovibrio sp.]